MQATVTNEATEYQRALSCEELRAVSALSGDRDRDGDRDGDADAGGDADASGLEFKIGPR